MFMNGKMREEIANILIEVAKEGMEHPRHLDAALDAIDATVTSSLDGGGVAPAGEATFLSFKPRGKWQYTGRGIFPEAAFGPGCFTNEEKLSVLLKANQDKWPGTSGRGTDMVRIVIPDPGVDHGWPLFFAAGL